MQLVIDIDEEQYKTIVNKIKAIRTEISKNGYANNDVVPIGWVSIAEGTPQETAEWIEDTLTKFKVACSKCGARNLGADRAYCPRCGRKMKEENDESSLPV